MKYIIFNKYKSYFYIFLLVVFFFIIFLRTGIFPLSGGDNLWASESAYWLINENSLKMGVLPGHSHNIVTYWPPIHVFFQVLIFKLFGLNQFTMTFQGTVHFFLIYLSSFLILRIKKLEFNQALLGGLFFFLSLNLVGPILHNRMDSLSYIFFIFAIIVLLKRSKNENYFVKFFLSGFLVAVSIISYYPLAPIILASFFYFLFISKIKISELCLIFSGFLIINIFFGIWILKDFNIFFSQVFAKENVSHYLNPLETVKYFFYAFEIPNLEYLICAILSIVMLVFSKDKLVKTLSFTSLISFIFLFLGKGERATFIIIPCILSFIIFFDKIVIFNENYIRLRRYFNLLMFFFIFVKISIITFISIDQYHSRSYSNAITVLDKYQNIKGKVGITQYAWLPTRKLYKFDQLLVMLDYLSSPQVKPYVSEIFFQNNFIDEFDMFVLYENENNLKTNYPLVYKNIDSDRFKQKDFFEINGISYVIYIRKNL